MNERLHERVCCLGVSAVIFLFSYRKHLFKGVCNAYVISLTTIILVDVKHCIFIFQTMDYILAGIEDVMGKHGNLRLRNK